MPGDWRTAAATVERVNVRRAIPQLSAWVLCFAALAVAAQPAAQLSQNAQVLVAARLADLPRLSRWLDQGGGPDARDRLG